MRLLTPRLVLRDLVPGDAPAFLAYHADPRYLALHGPGAFGPGHARDLLATFERWRTEAPRRHYQLGVFDRGPAGALLGCAGLRDVDRDRGTAELGVELAPDAWGRHGLAVEVAAALLDLGFGRLGLREVCGATASGNARASRLAAWFGAERAATREGPAWMRARGWSEVGWRLDREAWERSPAARRRARQADARRPGRERSPGSGGRAPGGAG